MLSIVLKLYYIFIDKLFFMNIIAFGIKTSAMRKALHSQKGCSVTSGNALSTGNGAFFIATFLMVKL